MRKIKELISLSGRSALITGASGHLGRSMAFALSDLGANLILVDRDSKKLDELHKELEALFKSNLRVISCDLSMEIERKQLIESIIRDYDRLNILINNAAYVGTSNLNGWSTNFELQNLDSWRDCIEVNLTAVFHLCQGLYPLIKISEGASIINIASIYGQLGPDWALYDGTSMGNPAAYSASKGGLIQLTRWLATTISPLVRVNSISPGGIERGQPDTFIDKYCLKTPLKRMASEDDLIGAVAYLASDLSSYVTGQNLMIDGGFSSW